MVISEMHCPDFLKMEFLSDYWTRNESAGFLGIVWAYKVLFTQNRF